jgi:type III pantothenate kinase
MDKIPCVLACDVGNSAIHFAAVRGDDVTGSGEVRIGELTGATELIRELWTSLGEPKKVVAGSVNPPALKALEAAVDESISQHVLVIGRDLPLPLDSDLPDPRATGVDRLCAAAAAFDQLGVACVVADFGTAITIDCVNDEGVFVGGAILPGLEMGARGLATQTAQLPKVELVDPTWVFGKDTRQAIVGGLVGSARGALREFVESYATELGHWPVVVVTGGDARLVCGDPSESDLVQCRVDDLTLRGVALAYYRSLLK